MYHTNDVDVNTSTGRGIVIIREGEVAEVEIGSITLGHINKTI
jgi:hypothetical protein